MAWKVKAEMRNGTIRFHPENRTSKAPRIFHCIVDASAIAAGIETCFKGTVKAARVVNIWTPPIVTELAPNNPEHWIARGRPSRQ